MSSASLAARRRRGKASPGGRKGRSLPGSDFSGCGRLLRLRTASRRCGRACISWGTSRARTSLRHRNNFRRLGQSSPVKTFAFELRVKNTHLGHGFRQTMPAWRFAQHQGRAVQFAWVIGFEPRNVQRNNPVEPTSFAVPDYYPIEVHLLLAAS
jgi:hypothetical protein